MIENDTWYRCNICGREGRVGRCCSDEDRTPLNDLARAEQERIEGAKNYTQQRLCEISKWVHDCVSFGGTVEQVEDYLRKNFA